MVTGWASEPAAISIKPGRATETKVLSEPRRSPLLAGHSTNGLTVGGAAIIFLSASEPLGKPDPRSVSGFPPFGRYFVRRYITLVHVERL